jgi:hypothetical protein
MIPLLIIFMRLRMYKICSVFVLAFLLYSCSNYQNLKTKIENPGCQTTISGNLHYNFKFSNKDTIMLLKRNISDILIKGKIIEKTNEGFIFDPNKRDGHDEGPKLYNFEDIKYIIGLDGKFIYGDLFDSIKFDNFSLKLTLSKFDSSIVKPYISSIVINANEPFDYCIEPGKYKIREISTLFFKHYSIDLPEIIFDVEKGKDNYLGDIYLDSLISGDNVNLLKFEYKKPIGKRRKKKDSNHFFPKGLLIQTWLDNEHKGFHSFFIKDEFIEKPGMKKSLLKFEK